MHPDKNGYTLVNPTPPPALRGLNADQPNCSNGVITVDAGRVRLAVDITSSLVP